MLVAYNQAVIQIGQVIGQSNNLFTSRFGVYFTLDIMTEPLPYHTEVLGLLGDLASLNQRIGPDELVALWFDALYFPAQLYVNAEGQAEWASCFSSLELAALAKFNSVFDSLADELPRGPGWEQGSGWLRVSTAAATALKEMTNDV